MADFRISVEADYSELDRLQRKINELQTRLDNYNPSITPQVDINKVRQELSQAQRMFNETAQRIGYIGQAARDNGIEMQSFGKRSVDAIKNAGKAAKETGDNFASMASQIGGLAARYSAVGIAMQGIYGAIGQLKQSINTIMSFQAANASLQAILGKTDEQMKSFQESAEALGRSTVFTASQVTQLQIALAKLGFTEAEIHAMEGKVLNFAQATGASLEDAASTTGAALKMFNVAADQYDEASTKFTNAMATATMSSALDFRMIRDNLATFGPMAASMGLHIEDVLALFGKLKDNGVEASTAMTSLRNIFTKVAQGKIPGMGKIGGEDPLAKFVEGLQSLKEQGMDVGGGMKAIGPRGGTQFITLINQAESIIDLRDRIKDGMEQDTTGGMAERMTNNLTGSLKMLQSAWEGFILTFKESDGVVKEVVDGMTSAIGTVRELIAADGDWSKETMQEIGTAIKWVLGAIASVKTLSLAKGLVNWTQGKVADIKDNVQAELLRKQGLEMAKNTGYTELNTKAIGERTAAVQASIGAMMQDLQLQRQQALESIKHSQGFTSQSLVILKNREFAVAQTNIQIQKLREKMQVEMQAAALTANATKQELIRKKMLILAEEELMAKKRLAENEELLREAQDTVLSENGKENLAEAADALENGLATATTKADKLKSVLNAFGLGFLTNPWILGAAAVGGFVYALYQINEKAHETERAMEKVADATNKVTEEGNKRLYNAKLNVVTLTKLKKGTNEYDKALSDLRAEMNKFGLSFATDKMGKEIITAESLKQKHEELTAAIRAEIVERQKLEAVRTANEMFDTDLEDVTKGYREDMEGIVVGGSQIASAVKQNLTEEDYAVIGKMQKINQTVDDMWNSSTFERSLSSGAEAKVQKQIEEYKKQHSAVIEAYNQITQKSGSIVQQAGSQMGYSQAQINKMSDATSKYLLNLEDIAVKNNKVQAAVESANNALDASMTKAEYKAKIAKMSLEGVRAEIMRLAKVNNIKISIDVLTNAKVPEWMRQTLGMDGKGSGNKRRALDMRNLYMEAINEATKNSRNTINVKGQGEITLAEAAMRANLYGLAAMQIDEEKRLYDELQKVKEEERRREAEAAEKAAKDRKAAQDRINNMMITAHRQAVDEMISLTKEGYERERAEIESAYEKKLETIRKEEDAMKAENAKRNSTKVKKEGTGKGGDKWETQLGSDALTTDQKKVYNLKRKAEERKRELSLANLDLKYERLHEDTEHETNVSKNSSKEDSYDTRLEAINLKFQKQVRDLERKRDDAYNAIIQTQEYDYLQNHTKEEWEQYKKDNSDKVGLPQDQKAKWEWSIKAANAAWKKELDNLNRENISNLLSTGKGIGERADNLLPDELRTLTAKMQSVEEKWDGVEQALNDLLENEDDSTKREELIMAKVNASVMKSTELIELDYENLLNTSGYRMAMTDLRNVTTKELNKIIGEFERVRESAAKNLPPSELKAFNDTIKEMRKAVADKNPFKGITSGLKAVKTARKNHETAVQELNGAEVNYEQQKSMLEWLENTIKQTKDDAVRKELEIQAKAQRDAVTKAKADVEGKRKKAEGTSEKLANEKDGLSEAIKSGLENISQAFEMFASRLDGVAGEIVGGLGGLLGSLGSNWSTLQGGGFQGWLAAASITLQAIDMSIGILDSIGTRNSRAIAKDDEIADLVDAVYAYRDAVREARQEEDAWFAQTRTGSVKQALEDNADAQEKYNAKLNEQQHKYRDASSGFSQYGIPVLTALGGAVLGTLIAGPVGAAIGGASGAAVGTGAQYGVDQMFGPGKGDIVAAKDNLRVQTRHRTAFRSEKTKDLQSWINDHMADEARKLGVSTKLFDEANNLNVELAEATLESGAVFAGNTQEILEELIKYQKEVNEFRDALHEYVSDLYSPMLDDMNNALWAWYEEGKNALDAYKEYASETFKDIAKEMTKEMMNRDIFDPLKEELNDITEKYIKGEMSDAEYSRQSADIMNKSAAMYEQNLPKYQRVVEVYAENAERAGMDFEKSTTEASGTVNSAKALTEDTANELVGRVTAIQLAVENVRGTQASLLTSLQTQLATAHSDIVLGMQSQFTALTDVRAILADSYIEIRGIKENTDTLITPIKAMNTNLEELRRKMETF